MRVPIIFQFLLVLVVVLWTPCLLAAKTRGRHHVKRDVEYQEELNLADGSHHVMKRHLSEDPLSRQKRTKRRALPALLRVKRRDENPLDGLMAETPLERAKRFKRHAKFPESHRNEIIEDKQHETKRVAAEDSAQVRLHGLHKQLKKKKATKEDMKAIRSQEKKRKKSLKKKNKRNKRLAKKKREMKKKMAASKLQKNSHQKKQKKHIHKKHSKKDHKIKKKLQKEKRSLKKNHHTKNKLKHKI